MGRPGPMPTCPAMPGCATAVHSVEPLHPLLSQQQVESALVAHKSVAEAAVVGYNHPIKGQGIWAYVTLKEVGCTREQWMYLGVAGSGGMPRPLQGQGMWVQGGCSRRRG